VDASIIMLTSQGKTYPQLLLFGDSITQWSTRTLQASLSEWYIRRLDVLNRGFSGYTAPLGLDTLQRFFPAIPPSDTHPRVRLMTVFFGANDSCLPGSPQHVPIERYKESLRRIIQYEGLKLHGTKVVLIVPPPVDEWQLGDNSRTAANTAKYASACREVGRELNLPTLDLWLSFMLRAGWRGGHDGALIGSRDAPKNQVLADLLSDGLHFTDMAYQLVYEDLVGLIQREVPDEAAEKLPYIFPKWEDLFRPSLILTGDTA